MFNLFLLKVLSMKADFSHFTKWLLCSLLFHQNKNVFGSTDQFALNNCLTIIKVSQVLCNIDWSDYFFLANSFLLSNRKSLLNLLLCSLYWMVQNKRQTFHSLLLLTLRSSRTTIPDYFFLFSYIDLLC